MQIDGQTEWENHTMEHYLLALSDSVQNNWVELSRLAEFAYIYSLHHSTFMTLFWFNYNYHHSMQFKPPKGASHLRTSIWADAIAAGLGDTHQLIKQNLLEAETWLSMYSGWIEITFAVGDTLR
jgi:hypothetical protein